MPKINERIRLLRIQHNITQTQLAFAIDVQPASIQRFEYGTMRPSLDKLIALADYFNISLDYLVGRSDDPSRY